MSRMRHTVHDVVVIEHTLLALNSTMSAYCSSSTTPLNPKLDEEQRHSAALGPELTLPTVERTIQEGLIEASLSKSVDQGTVAR
mmetsp:Transcript_15626/g.34154  ORF Transcript_15626/g.34154 Transcript_15626/m.34154 type:complete len:84 (+) Transcript_15626:676-927(+)